MAEIITVDDTIQSLTLEQAAKKLVEKGWKQFWSFHPSMSNQFKDASGKVDSIRKMNYEACLVIPTDYTDVCLIYRKDSTTE